jgi:hypothetical protein
MVSGVPEKGKAEQKRDVTTIGQIPSTDAATVG